jgi:hypothetical protein
LKETSLVMPYGKYRGTRICDLPSDYLKWLAETISEKDARNKNICLAADREYQQRMVDGEL